MKRVFVSHPYTDNPVVNKIKADKICKRLYRQGVLPISPLHLFSFIETDKDRDDIMAACFALIAMCDELWVFGDSDGTDTEVRYAWNIGIPVVDCTVENWDKFTRERSEVNVRGD